ncbi:MAG: metallophosphoesterase [Sinobacteraceae bacterium]|nr:metallophosphoesterase [Nevskiaceae bacterium]
MRFIHLSDPHLTTLDGCRPRDLRGKRLLGYLSWRRRRRFEHRRAHLDALVDAVRRQGGDQLLVSGDLTHLGLPAELQAARGWLETLGEPGRVTVVPGNHDVFARGSMAAVVQAWSPYLHLDGDAGYPAVRNFDGVQIINSCSAVPTAPLLASGRLGKTQLDRLRRVLDVSFDGVRILVIHHPPFSGMISRRKALTDAPALERLAVGHINLVLHGHGHRNSEFQRGAVTVLGTTSASLPGASFRVIDIGEHAGDFDFVTRLHERRADGSFAATAEQRFRIDPARRRASRRSAAG